MARDLPPGIEKIILPNGEVRYEVRWKTPDRDTRKRRFRTEAEARRYKTEVDRSKDTGSYVDQRSGRITFMTYAEEWRIIQIHRPNSARKVERDLRLHVYGRLGGRSIGAIRRSEVQALVKHLSEYLAPTMVSQVYGWVAAVFQAAVADRAIPATPCADIQLPNIDPPKIVPLATETVEALANGVPPRYRALIVLGAGTGVRISEALAVTSDRVDWMRRTLEVDRQIAQVVDGRPVFGPVKDTKNRPRTIPLGDVVMAGLVEHVRRYGLGPDGLLFTNDRGGALDRDAFTPVWRRVARPLGIPAGDGYHQLRHYFASLLIRGGGSILLVQQLLGHQSLVTTQMYAHLFPDSGDQAREAVDRVLGSMGSFWGPSAEAEL